MKWKEERTVPKPAAKKVLADSSDLLEGVHAGKPCTGGGFFARLLFLSPALPSGYLPEDNEGRGTM